MPKSTKIIIGVVGLFIVGVIALAVNNDSENLPSTNSLPRVAQGEEVPDLTLKDYDGNDVNIKEIEGGVVLLNAWAAWCPFCVDEIPDFIQAQIDLGDDITVVLINRQESLDRAKGFSDDLGANGVVITLLDPNDSFYRQIGGFAMPETLFVKDGNVILHKRGPITLQEVKLIVRNALEPS